jgi:hypothetical protein
MANLILTGTHHRVDHLPDDLYNICTVLPNGDVQADAFEFMALLERKAAVAVVSMVMDQLEVSIEDLEDDGAE